MTTTQGVLAVVAISILPATQLARAANLPAGVDEKAAVQFCNNLAATATGIQNSQHLTREAAIRSMKGDAIARGAKRGTVENVEADCRERGIR